MLVMHMSKSLESPHIDSHTFRGKDEWKALQVFIPREIVNQHCIPRGSAGFSAAKEDLGVALVLTHTYPCSAFLGGL